MTLPSKRKQKKKPVKKYYVVVFCQNCRERFECKVPKGQTVWDFLEGSTKLNKCDTCGCNIVQSRYKIWGDLLK